MTRDEAVKLSESGWWNQATSKQIVDFQLNEELLCLPFAVFHKAVEDELGRPVWTHEFAKPDLLRAELKGDRKQPTFAEICALIPALVVLDMDAEPNA